MSSNHLSLIGWWLICSIQIYFQSMPWTESTLTYTMWASEKQILLCYNIILAIYFSGNNVFYHFYLTVNGHRGRIIAGDRLVCNVSGNTRVVRYSREANSHTHTHTHVVIDRLFKTGGHKNVTSHTRDMDSEQQQQQWVRFVAPQTISNRFDLEASLIITYECGSCALSYQTWRMNRKVGPLSKLLFIPEFIIVEYEIHLWINVTPSIGQFQMIFLTRNIECRNLSL